MSNGIRKIQAFTLNELLVVLLITSIVIGMGFSVLQLVQRQMHGISGVYETQTEINLLRQSLWIDFNSYDGVWYDADNDELIFGNQLQTSRYQWFESYIVKDSDTFHLKTGTKHFYYNGLQKEYGELDGLDLSFTENDGNQRIMVYKTNAASSYLNQ
ncbi:type II secretion system GspH family protein [Muricauda sp. 2012CJ35-5]|uniref:Type II secretion system GspH family protein n=1 Tax=Flagellimonas spongiicola TaxID=2942208 RepID=A0ABT0PVR3_9FLAO|nr:type II secretion system protein [Allomuricauda spongiicola]MCL6275449.1 type II secretion system GspH family protein [Allomuricauda spongiicola]